MCPNNRTIKQTRQDPHGELPGACLFVHGMYKSASGALRLFVHGMYKSEFICTWDVQIAIYLYMGCTNPGNKPLKN